MVKNDIINDRRTAKRYKVRAGFNIISEPFNCLIGPALDISTSGLGFRYYQISGLREKMKSLFGKTIQISIFSDTGETVLKNITAKIVYGLNGNGTNNGTVKTKNLRCGIEFEENSKKQTLEIQDFIQACTVKGLQDNKKNIQVGPVFWEKVKKYGRTILNTLTAVIGGIIIWAMIKILLKNKKSINLQKHNNWPL